VPATVIVGAQWGDEGKGKIVDLLAQDSDLVCRYQGGPNAGHTIVVGDETYKIRQIPTGVIAGKRCAIGAGCVVDPAVLIEELDEVEARGHATQGLLFVSGNAHLVMPWHVALDGARERRLGRLQIGTTRRGIGPAYADKATRIGIRVQDLLDPKILRQKLELAVAEKNVWLERVYELEPFDVENVVSTQLGYAERLAPYVADTSLLVDRALRAGERVVFEGAQGTLLDLDHGTYPFVTSSSPIAAGAAVSFGIGPQRIDEVLGVAKAYVTRVGEGPFPSEIVGPDHARVQELGLEFGTVTGRERRCGWLDLVALRFAVRVNGITSLALTKLDVLSAFAELPVCLRYRLPDGSETEDFPAHQTDFHHCRPVFEVLPGWTAPIDDDLPGAAHEYVRFVERELDVPVTLVGTGAAREHVLTLR
jgi:adenylosuccinate synthase